MLNADEFANDVKAVFHKDRRTIVRLAERGDVQIFTMAGVWVIAWLLLSLDGPKFFDFERFWKTAVVGLFVLPYAIIPLIIVCYVLAAIVAIVTYPIGWMYDNRIRRLVWPWVTISIVASFLGLFLYKVLSTPYSSSMPPYGAGW